MPVTPLSSPPTPPNNNMGRGMFVWVTSNSSQNPINSDTKIQNLLNFCSSNGVNVLFLDVWVYLGGGNWSAANVTQMQKVLDSAHRSGIRVYALAGNTDWAINQSWVQTNIVKRLADFQAKAIDATHRFDGVILDVEYWTDGNQTSSVSCPGLCDLVRNMKTQLNVPVGVFTTFWLKDNSGSQPSFSYQGKTAQDGEFLMDNCDFVVVGAYRDHAEDNVQDGPGQITLFQPWYDYASTAGKNNILFCGSETINVSPAYVTYFGATKASMETQHTLISNAFVTGSNSVFAGQCVHSYDGWKAMT